MEAPTSLVFEPDESEEETVQLGCVIAESIGGETETPVQPAGSFVEVEAAEVREPGEGRRRRRRPTRSVASSSLAMLPVRSSAFRR
ncbi:hypothetical protein ACFQE1_04045 [Halobium palmae]|uniref:Uncharacterized protein n=1 Tax=Halobium palmae TaxID=1776492 RepID=A0ABD5RWG5_9EURY